MYPARVLIFLVALSWCLVSTSWAEFLAGGRTEVAANKTVNGLSSTIVGRSHERVLMRRKRFLIFPKGAAIVVSIDCGRAIRSE